MSAMELQKHILDHIRLKAEEDVEAELFKAYGTDPDRMVSAIQKEGMIALKVAQYMQEMRNMQDQLSGGGGEDPLVGLKQKEIDQRAAADQARIQVDNKRLALDQQKLSETTQINRQKLQLMAAKQTQPQGVPNAA
jgi:hypothetical protein